jgi:hypothetical protein
MRKFLGLVQGGAGEAAEPPEAGGARRAIDLADPSAADQAEFDRWLDALRAPLPADGAPARALRPSAGLRVFGRRPTGAGPHSPARRRRP